jgi:hypothetical protein
MRTNIEENIAMGEFLAKLANSAKKPIEFVLPLGGFSVLGQAGNKFSNSDADNALIDSIKTHCDNDIVTTVNQSINHPEVIDILIRKIHIMIQKSENKSKPELYNLDLRRSYSVSTSQVAPEREHTLASSPPQFLN